MSAPMVNWVISPTLSSKLSVASNESTKASWLHSLADLLSVHPKFSKEQPAKISRVFCIRVRREIIFEALNSFRVQITMNFWLRLQKHQTNSMHITCTITSTFPLIFEFERQP
jgi:hypothetical protein